MQHSFVKQEDRSFRAVSKISQQDVVPLKSTLFKQICLEADADTAVVEQDFVEA